MFKSNKIKEPPKITAIRVLILTLPSALFIAFLAIMGTIDIFVGLTGYMCILFLSMTLMAGFMTDLQSVVDYAKNVSEGKNVEIPTLQENASETAILIQSINKIHNIWSDKINDSSLSLSDSAILDNIPEPLLLLNEDLEIVGSNLNAHTIFNGEIRNKHIKELITDENIQKEIIKVQIKEKYEASIESIENNPFKFLIFKILRLPAKAKGGATIMILINDITFQKDIERKQIEFFANASHELKTPLSVISGFIETIKTSAKDDTSATESFLNIIYDQTSEMTKLINDLLSISKLESSEAHKKTTKTNIYDICKNLQESLTLNAQKKSMQIALDFDNNKVNINADIDSITQVCRNLIENAIKYGKQDSAITIKGSQTSNNRVNLTFTNKLETQLTKEEINNLTERFYRGNSAKTNKIPGTGLGLAIVKAIVKNYNGKLDISADKEDFTVTVELASK